MFWPEPRGVPNMQDSDVVSLETIGCNVGRLHDQFAGRGSPARAAAMGVRGELPLERVDDAINQHDGGDRIVLCDTGRNLCKIRLGPRRYDDLHFPSRGAALSEIRALSRRRVSALGETRPASASSIP